MIYNTIHASTVPVCWLCIAVLNSIHPFFSAVFLMSSKQSYFYAAIVAVITVQIMLGIFIFVAYREGSEVYDKPYKAE
jgi:hypothetical protein